MLPNSALGNQRDAGFTLIEVLIASTLIFVVLGFMISLIAGTGQIQQRNSAQLNVDDALRSSLELMSMDLREATVTRVLSTSAPTGLASWLTSGTVLTVTQTPPINTFFITEPIGYPANTVYSTPLSVPLVSPNAASQNCSTTFVGGDYALATNGTQTVWLGVAAPCAASSLALTTPLWGSGFTWNPNASVGKVTITRYSVDPATNTLVRQIRGSAAQVVAYNVSGLTVEYTTNGTTWTSTSAAAPQAVRLTLAGLRTVGSQTSTLSLTSTIFMRDLSTPAPPTSASSTP